MTSDAAEAVIKFYVEGMEVALKVLGAGAKNLAVMLYVMSKDKKTSKGRVKLNDMLKTGKSLQLFALDKKDLKKFHEEAKYYGVSYCMLANKKDKANDGMVDILVKEDDALRINRIIDRYKLAAIDTVSVRSEINKDKINDMVSNAEKDNTYVANLDELANELLSPPKTEEVSNPELATTEKNPLSERSYKSRDNLGVNSNSKKPSVRAELTEIKEELKRSNSSNKRNINRDTKISKNKRKKER